MSNDKRARETERNKKRKFARTDSLHTHPHTETDGAHPHFDTVTSISTHHHPSAYTDTHATYASTCYVHQLRRIPKTRSSTSCGNSLASSAVHTSAPTRTAVRFAGLMKSRSRSAAAKPSSSAKTNKSKKEESKKRREEEEKKHCYYKVIYHIVCRDAVCPVLVWVCM